MAIPPGCPVHGESLEELLSQIQHAKHKLCRESATTRTAEGISSQDAEEIMGWRQIRFHPMLHIAPQTGPVTKWTFEDLGIQLPASATSIFAGTSSFPLFTLEAIQPIREAVLNPRYIDETAVVFGPKTLILRNTAAHSPFFRHLWTNPLVLNMLSQAAGVPLEPVMETMELGHTNVQVDFSKYARYSRHEMLENIAYELTFEKYSNPRTGSCMESRSEQEVREAASKEALLPWHYDSYPWVCVAMVSDTSNMCGGETVIERGDGTYVGIAQPGMGSAMMLQGGLVKHLALTSGSTSYYNDRITIITSFRAKAVGIYDSSFLSNIRPYSDLEELYKQWIDYRLDRLIPGMRKLNNKQRYIKVFGDEDIQAEAEERIVLREYAKRTLRQMVPATTIEPLVERLGYSIFYNIRDDYVNGILFRHPPILCQLCRIPFVVVDKIHLALCPKRQLWRPNSPVWNDCVLTGNALQDNGIELAKRMEELQVKDIFLKWKYEGRPWGIVDEMAVQGLGEYIIEFLELCGMQFVI